MFSSIDLSDYFYKPEILAKRVLEIYFSQKIPSYPIDPFDILKQMNIVYQFRDFRDLEGIYIVPEDEDDIAIVGINNNRPVTRQRFTAAHELCHHIKDKNESSICPIDGREKNPIEKYADKFASELLMPTEELKKQVGKFENNGYINFENIIYIADYFGVSFEACVFNIAYKLNKIEGNIEPLRLKKRINKFKPDKKRIELGFKKYDSSLLKNIINSYDYFYNNESKAVWYKFKNDFIYNENRLEGVNIDKEDVAEILTDIRIYKQNSVYCKSEYKDIIEVVGHASMYDFLLETEEPISIFKLLKLHTMLFQFAPYPEAAGKIRNSNNFVTEAKFETVDYNNIINELLKLEEKLKKLINKMNDMSIAEYIEEAVKIHHRITVIHPFIDGNGRCSRVMLNWLFKIKGLPPVYLKYDNKDYYYEALKEADLNGDYSYLCEVFYREIIRSMIQLNTKFKL
ncbi:ImmA/IrrE family metallo-endopeptidase [Clostridium sp. JN-9]|uniref:ImmA/IrrE family metallo-endopeptidase n=1 Tax=Clostridium sp. JN-9 TaxID=2507159 RepID=UPI000FFE10AF|nr:ImmA/IrrE family metallo-endopeptidase [Clostridium sp. JN-9]QAT40653.1 ImmA/IrrE family metallo-endopeptidase [Clostridium sp. JN-9]